MRIVWKDTAVIRADFKYRGYAEGCQHNLKMFGYYGEVKYKPNDKFYINKNNTEDMK